MTLSLRTSVNRWECDENDHMNVRFFLQKHWEALCSGTGASELVSKVRSHHIRFHREVRIAAPISGYWETVSLASSEARYLTELRQSFTQEVMSTCLHQLEGLLPQERPQDESLNEAVNDIPLVPEIAAPRGVPNGRSVFAEATYDSLQARGFRLIGVGRIEAYECDSNGRLLPYRYMGRLSDSMPHLWGAVHEGGVLDENEGGAVLEYRMEYFEGLKAEDGYEIWSGLRGVGAKVQEFVHLIFNRKRQLAMVAEAVGVRLDLIARKSKVLSPEVVSLMHDQVVDHSGLN